MSDPGALGGKSARTCTPVSRKRKSLHVLALFQVVVMAPLCAAAAAWLLVEGHDVVIALPDIVCVGVNLGMGVPALLRR